MFYFVFFNRDGDHRELHVLTHSVPNRRSSDLKRGGPPRAEAEAPERHRAGAGKLARPSWDERPPRRRAPHRGRSYAWLKSSGERGRNEPPAALSRIRGFPLPAPPLPLNRSEPHRR